MDISLPRPKRGGSLFLGVGSPPTIRILCWCSHCPKSLERKLTWASCQHLVLYPSVHRLSHFVKEIVPFGPLLVQTSRFVAGSTGRRILGLGHGTPFGLEGQEEGADYRHSPALRRLFLLLDSAAAHALRGIDHLVLLTLDAGGKIWRRVVSSALQLIDLAKYLNRTYHEEASKWAGASDVISICGAATFTVALVAFDALVVVAEWYFDGREAREIESMAREWSFWRRAA